MAVKAIDDLSLVRGVTVTVTSPDNVVEVITPEQQEFGDALWYFWFEPTIEGEYTFEIEAIDSVNNTTINNDAVYVDDSPPVGDIDASLEATVLTTEPEDVRDPNSINLFGTVTDNRVLGEQIEIDLLDWQNESALSSETISVTIDNQNDSLGTWGLDYQMPGPVYGQYDVWANMADILGNSISNTIGAVTIDDFGPWADVTVAGDDLSQSTISGTVSDLRYNAINRVVHFHFEEAAGATTFVDGTQYQSTATCSGGSCPRPPGRRPGRSSSARTAPDSIAPACR